MLKGRFKKGSSIKQTIGRILKPSQLIMLLLAVIFVVTAFLFCRKLIGYYLDDQKYQEIAAQVPQVNPSEYFDQTQREQAAPVHESHDEDNSVDEPEVKPPYEVIQGNPEELDDNGILKDYSVLHKQNNQLAGWIRVPGFKKAISYPLMYSGDDTYYLNRDFYGNDSYAGSIFFDSRNDPQTVDRHIILYGHAMKDMSMFGNFKEYPNQAGEMSDVRYIYVDTLKYRMEYEIFSAYYADSTDNYRETEFHSDAYFVAFAKGLQNRSLYDFGTEPITSRDRLLTLSTCRNELLEDGRTVIHARLRRLITYQGGSFGGSDLKFIDEGPEKPVTANVYIAELKLTYTLSGDNIVPQEDLSDGQTEKIDNGQPSSTPLPTQEHTQTPEAGALSSPDPPSPKPSLAPVEVILDPPFNTALKEFSGTVPEMVEEVTVEVKPSDPKAKIEVTLNDEVISSNPLPLDYGENSIEINVISRDWLYSRKYYLIITRTPPPGYEDANESEPSDGETSEGESPDEAHWGEESTSTGAELAGE